MFEMLLMLLLLTRMRHMTTLRGPGLSGLRRRGAVLPLALLGVALLALPAVADSLEEIREKQERERAAIQRLDSKGDNLTDVVAQLDAARAQAEAKVDAVKRQLGQIDKRIQAKKRQLSIAQKRMAVLTVELQGILGELGDRTDVFVDRAVAAYKAGPSAVAETVLSGDDFNDVIDRYTYYQAALDADSEMIDEITVLRDGVEERRLEVEERQTEIAAARIALLSDRAQMEVLHQQRAAVLAERKQIVDQKASILASVRQRQSFHEAELAAFQAAEDEKLALLAAASNSNGNFPSGGGQLLWPAAGSVTSGYGYRVHPIFGDRRLHTGIDIGAPYGAPVIASDGGYVVFAGVMSGYGNAIVIDHGGGLGTTYNHLSSFTVSSGQTVARGAQIGNVGCSGYCTGAHLHFEVRVDGSPVDPMPYLQ
jgi:murein DD-endopeptidase MepM/ murein hydrolase activator NlpD